MGPWLFLAVSCGVSLPYNGLMASSRRASSIKGTRTTASQSCCLPFRSLHIRNCKEWDFWNITSIILSQTISQTRTNTNYTHTHKPVQILRDKSRGWGCWGSTWEAGTPRGWASCCWRAGRPSTVQRAGTASTSQSSFSSWRSPAKCAIKG